MRRQMRRAERVSWAAACSTRQRNAGDLAGSQRRHVAEADQVGPADQVGGGEHGLQPGAVSSQPRQGRLRRPTCLPSPMLSSRGRACGAAAPVPMIWAAGNPERRPCEVIRLCRSVRPRSSLPVRAVPLAAVILSRASGGGGVRVRLAPVVVAAPGSDCRLGRGRGGDRGASAQRIAPPPSRSARSPLTKASYRIKFAES
jgi:hypothetical protein